MGLHQSDWMKRFRESPDATPELQDNIWMNEKLHQHQSSEDN